MRYRVKEKTTKLRPSALPHKFHMGDINVDCINVISFALLQVAGFTLSTLSQSAFEITVFAYLQ